MLFRSQLKRYEGVKKDLAAASVAVSSAVLSDAITPAVPIIDTVVTANSVASAFTVLFFIVSSSFGTNVPGGCSLSESVVLM